MIVEKINQEIEIIQKLMFKQKKKYNQEEMLVNLKKNNHNIYLNNFQIKKKIIKILIMKIKCKYQ